MGYPATGIEAFYRNTRSDIKRFFSLYHPMTVKVSNSDTLLHVVCTDCSFRSIIYALKVKNCTFRINHLVATKLLPSHFKIITLANYSNRLTCLIK